MECSQRQNCSVAASTRGFGDPCPGTLKYLEAQFQCVPVNLPHGRPRPSWLMEAQSTVSSITGDQPLQRPPQARDRGNDVGGFGPSSDADGFGGLPDTADADGILDSELLAPDGGGNSSSVDSPADDRGGSPSRGRDDSGAPAKIPVSLPDPQEDVEGDQNLGEDEVREREDLFEEQDRLLEKEMGHIFPQHYPHSPYGQDHVDENLLSPGWRPRESWCGPSSGRGLLWNWTRAGEKAIQACPGGASGWARRDCYPGGWASRADLGECRSVWLSTLTARAQGTDSVLAVVHDLSAVTAVRALYGGDVTAAARLLSSLAKRMATSLSHFPDTSQREALLSELLSATLASASHLIGSQEDAWGDLQPDEHRAAVTALLLGLEQAAFLLADNLRQQKVVVDSYPNILMRLQVLETRNVAYPVTFPSMDEVWQVPTPQPGPPSPSNPSIPPLGEPAVSSVILNPSSSAPYEGSSSPNLGDRAIGPPSYDSITLPPEALLENSENRLIKMLPNRTRLLNSRVLAASLGSGRHIELTEPVVVTFALLSTENVTNASCVFWDYTTK
ncbi:hypothetical protein HAZT_HAZT010407 [Hyalella azteca]|uniref:Uncharacterized protein n=1 Tax=Hyalella azteca TaxID=294128 RepID=A0A6A0GT63_HYAAZ|nr:hypothetical protein HAZT_HAZT010407 [Hyalella azteca]